MTEIGKAHLDFAPIWQAAESLLPSTVSAALRAGLAGEIMRRADTPLLASDLTHLLIPGLAALGIEAQLTPLFPEEADQVTETEKRGLLAGFSAPLLFTPPEEINDATPLPGDTDPRITALVVLSKTSLPLASPSHEALERSPARFSYRLLLEQAVERPLRRESVYAALHRWLAWHAAYPERAPREGNRTDPTCVQATAFLLEVAGTRRDYVSNRLRYAARCLEAAQVADAYGWLLEAGMAVWQLSAAGAEALRSAPERPLSDTLRQELIYLARAGALPLKTLAARRLTYEIHHPDARKTLHQLRFDPAAWVRAASLPRF